MPDGSLAVAVTPCDLKLYKVLALDRANGLTGRCDPGYRSLAADAKISRGTVGNSTERLRATGWIGWKRKLHYVNGTLRWGRAYFLPPEPPELRPRFAAKPMEVIKRLWSRVVDKPELATPIRSVEAQIASIREWVKGATKGACPPGHSLLPQGEGDIIGGRYRDI